MILHFRQIKTADYGWLLVVSVAFLSPILVIGLPVGSPDLFHHMTIANAWANAFQDGSLIPNWVYPENNGYGAVTVRFYPPLIHITLALFKMMFRDWGSAVFAGFLFWSVVGSLGVYIWAKDVIDSRKAALAAAAIFVFTPYHVNQFYHGFFWGEFVSLSVAPFCFYFVRRLQLAPSGGLCLGLSFFLALLILSNTPQLIVTAICLGIYFLMLIDRRTILRSLGFVAAAGAMSLALTSFFWVRQVVEMSWIKVGRPGIDPQYDYKNNFLLTELWLRDGLNDLAMMFFGTYFLVVMVALLIVAICVSGKYLTLWINKQDRAIGTIFLVSAFMTTFASQFIWDAIPLLHRIQFPWRFLSIASLCFSVLMGLSLDFISVETWRDRRPAVLALVGTVLILLTFSIKQDILAATFIDHKSFEAEVADSFEKKGLDHWHPVWTTMETFTKPDEPVNTNGRELSVTEWSERGHELSVAAGSPTIAQTAITYYPYWQVSINDKPVPTLESNGALAFTVPESSSEVTLRFVEPNYSIISRWVSFAVSIIFLLTVAFYLRRSLSPEELLA
jgi:6-pyruvoyl-tetrahydropterin synthase related domain